MLLAETGSEFSGSEVIFAPPDLLGMGGSVKQIGQVVEGIQTVREVMMVAQRINIDMPICEQVYAVIYGGVEPLVAVQTLLARAQKPESYD